MKKNTKKEPRFDSQAYWDEFENRFLRGDMKTIPNFEQHRKDLAASARAQREKTKLVSIRVREYDLERLRAKAEREGLPYQTLINSLIHKYAQSGYKH